ncbi:forkhead-associated protein [Calothrix sp. NIES-2100]|uniref:FHA domain-containing protein n=1 Tax=Calothrix sp. NIES-2100 TaxID=1954172 RepID=UPI000B601909|nr:forkhead-associated protein [Calothrix sp. NIES-2100]
MKVKVNYSPTLNEVNELDLALATTPTGECIIGRSPDSDLVLDSPDVSRIHGKFFIQSGNYYFCDLGSRNGSIVNGKIAEKNRPFLLKDKDIIRIGDYVIAVEDLIPLSEQPETVFRTIDPALFSGLRGNDNLNNINVANQAREVLQQPSSKTSEVETSELEEAINALESTLETPEEISEQEVDADTPVAEEVTSIQPEDFISPAPEAVSEVSAVVSDEIVSTPVAEEVTSIQSEDFISPTPEAVSEVPAVVSDEVVSNPVAEEVTSIQPQDLISPAPEVVNQVPVEINYQDIDWDAEIPQEFTIVQLRDLHIPPSQIESEVPPDINEQNIDVEAEIIQEFTNVQPRDIFSPPPELVDEVPPDVAEILRDFTIIQPRNVENEPLDVESEISEAITNQDGADDFRVDIAPVEAPEFVNSFTPEFSHEDDEDEYIEDSIIVSGYLVSAPSDIVGEVPVDVNNQEVNLSATNAVEFSAETAKAFDFESSTVNEISDVTKIDFGEKTEELEDEAMPELISNKTSESISQTLNEIFGTEKTLSDEIAQQVPASEPQQIINQKNIVLIAHESKKSELADFVNQHKEFFLQSLTVACPSISEVLHQQTGITVNQQIPAATSGGYQTINSLVNSGEVLAVIFLRDFLVPQPSQANEEAFLRSCNINEVLLATNLPTAEAIVHYLKHVWDHQ